MNNSNETRYQRALKRNLHEVGRALLEQKAMVGLEKAETNHAVDFIRISYDALFNDYFSHAIKALDKHVDSASFWYIKRCKEKETNNYIRENNIDIESLIKVSESLKHVRDKTHFHIDKDAVKNPKKIWSEASIKGSALATCLNNVWDILNYLYKLEFKEEFYYPEYNGGDATKIAKFAESI